MQHPTETRLGPDRLSGLGTGPQPHGQSDLALLELAHHLPGAAKSLEQLEEELLTEAVKRADGNLAGAARILGITRPQLQYRLKRNAP